MRITAVFSLIQNRPHQLPARAQAPQQYVAGDLLLAYGHTPLLPDFTLSSTVPRKAQVLLSGYHHQHPTPYVDKGVSPSPLLQEQNIVSLFPFPPALKSMHVTRGSDSLYFRSSLPLRILTQSENWHLKILSSIHIGIKMRCPMGKVSQTHNPSYLGV